MLSRWCTRAAAAAVVVRKEAPGTVYGAGYPRCHGLVDGDGPGAALVRRRRLVAAVASCSVSFSLALAFSLAFPFLVASHLFVLDRAVSLLHLSVAVVRRAAASPMEALAVHRGICRTNVVSAIQCNPRCRSEYPDNAVTRGSRARVSRRQGEAGLPAPLEPATGRLKLHVAMEEKRTAAGGVYSQL